MTKKFVARVQVEFFAEITLEVENEDDAWEAAQAIIDEEGTAYLLENAVGITHETITRIDEVEGEEE